VGHPVYLSVSTRFGRLCAHHQEKQMYLCDTWYLLFCVDDSLVCTLHIRESSTQNKKYQVSHKHSCISWWWAHSQPKHVKNDKYNKNKYARNKLCNDLALFTRLYRVIGQQNKKFYINPLNPELNPICYLLALLGAHHFLHVSRIRVKLLTFRLLMSYIYGAPILDVSRSHTTTQHSR